MGVRIRCDRLTSPGAFMVRDPISGRYVTDGLFSKRVGPRFALLHGLADDVVPVTSSRAFASCLEQIGWPVDLVELAADHGTIAGAEYNPVVDRYEPAKDGPAQHVASEVAARIAAILGR